MGILGIIKKGVFGAADLAVDKYGSDIIGTAFNTVTDTIESIIAGKRTFDEWAELLEPSIDKAVDRIREEDGLQYVGGKLKFTFKDSSLRKILISYELFFIDSENKWKKVEAKSDVFSNTFSEDCLTELEKKKEVAYEVTG